MADSGYREKAKERFNGVCVRCGEEVEWEDVQVHHVDRDHGNERLDNLEPLCHPCHSEEHNGPDPLWRVVVSMPRPVLESVDEAVEERGFESRSEAVNRAIADTFGGDGGWFGGPEESVNAWFGDGTHARHAPDEAHPPQRE